MIDITGNVYFSSDLHLSHKRIMIYCKRYQFLTPDEIEQIEFAGSDKHKQRQIFISDKSMNNHDDYIIEKINDVVKPNDTYINLGDIFFCNLDKAKYLRSKINCKNIHAIYGNHDDHHTVNSTFNSATYYREIRVNKIQYNLFHYSIVPGLWHKSNKAIHLYGHSHSNAEDMLDEKFSKNRKCLDVGIDNAKKILGDYIPFSSSKILELLNTNII